MSLLVYWDGTVESICGTVRLWSKNRRVTDFSATNSECGLPFFSYFPNIVVFPDMYTSLTKVLNSACGLWHYSISTHWLQTMVGFRKREWHLCLNYRFRLGNRIGISTWTALCNAGWIAWPDHRFISHIVELGTFDLPSVIRWLVAFQGTCSSSSHLTLPICPTKISKSTILGTRLSTVLVFHQKAIFNFSPALYKINQSDENSPEIYYLVQNNLKY